MSGRTYLSIGDVLTLLRQEFPDVTISKIRFLESQGLVNPERSPSGYRKFFEHDVERLRWVLRQQREHFLPLKVIRDRLADGELDEGAESDAEGPNGKPARRPAHAAAGEPVSVGAAGDQPTKADEEAMARILADASRRAARMPEAAQARRGLQVVGEDEHAPEAGAETPRPRVGTSTVQEAGLRPGQSAASGDAPAGAAGGGGATRPGASGTGTGNGTSLRRADTAAATPAAAHAAPPASAPASAAAPTSASAPTRPSTASSAPAPAQASARKAGAASGSGPAASGPAASGPAPGTTSGVVTGASLTKEELSAASGLSPEEVAGLEGFGLVAAVMVAGIPTYDEDALTVANLAAAFRAFGIEPRHLRLYRNAADREMGLIEQVVIPLLRQRNPESRQRAMEGADQLAALGQSMRATLLRQALRRHLGG